MQHTNRTDTGPFALTPEWVLDAEISDRAKVLYAVLGRYADDEGKAWPSRRTLAERLRCSPESIDRAVRELREVAALSIVERARPDGSRTSNEYTLYRSPPVPRVLRTADEGGIRTADEARNESQLERDVETSATPQSLLPPRHPRQVDRVRVTEEEDAAAIAILASFNVQAGTSFRSDEWLAKIIRRIREYPEATYDDHREIIRVALADPWWSGPPNPSVIYGNAAQFERSVQAVRATLAKGDDDERLERIVAEALRTREEL